MSQVLDSDAHAVSDASTVLTAASDADQLALLGGGKGRNLFRLTHAGLPVPAWSIIGANAFERLRTGTPNLSAEIASALDGLTPTGAREAAARIAAAVQRAPLDAVTLHAIEEAYARVGTPVVAVRSSGFDEDGARHSFAGLHDTFLNVVGKDAVVERVRACWASGYSARALAYRLAHGLDPAAVRLAVVVQALVPAEKSGVLFTVNPTTGDTEELVVSSVLGLGEGLVSGAIDGDTFVVSRQTGTLMSVVTGEKRERVEPSADGGGCVLREVASSERAQLSLTPEELAMLRDYGERIEQLLGGPQDVEWAIAGGRLAILQSRPVTAATGQAPDGELRIWDNSNIVESFGDITTPLTFSFACHVYHRVYHEYCELLGVPGRQLEQMDQWLPNMLAYFNGRVYYNLLNWYRVIRLLPFYRANRRILELSIGVDEPLSEALAEAQRPFVAPSARAEMLIRARIALRFTGWFLVIERLVDRFVTDFERVYAELDARDPDEMRAEELFALYRDVEQRLLKRWGRMILLEATLGLSFGVLYALTRRWLPDAPASLLWEVAKVDDTVESADQARQLQRIAEFVRSEPQLRDLLGTSASEDTLVALTQAALDDPAAARVLGAVDQYLERFGHRSANELKLEEPDLREDSTPLFAQVRGTVTRLDIGTTADRTATNGADAYLAQELRLWQRGIYEVVRRKVRRSLAARERVRLCRTRAFGLTRRVFKTIGRDMAAGGALRAEDDVFQLRLDELRGWFDGTLSARDLSPLVEIRHAEAQRSRGLDAPTRFVTHGAASADAVESAWRKARRAIPTSTGALSGTPCSSGVVDGTARLVDTPRDVGGDVLVTYRTDPGWIAALPSASALLIERGSPLTHVAIVARELGIPTIVQVRGLTRRLRDGTRVRVDGGAGTIAILNGAGDA